MTSGRYVLAGVGGTLTAGLVAREIYSNAETSPNDGGSADRYRYNPEDDIG